MKQLSENETILYRVVFESTVLIDSVPMGVAENFLSSLAKHVQESAQIVPVTSDGLQVLLG